MGAVADEANDIILLMDKRGHVCDANRAALATYGYSHTTRSPRSTFATCARRRRAMKCRTR